jgi:hypothetical protein
MQPGVAAFEDTVVDGDIVYDSVISVVHIATRASSGRRIRSTGFFKTHERSFAPRYYVTTRGILDCL